MTNIALFDADGTLHEGYVIFPVYNAFAAEGLVEKSDNQQLQEVLKRYEAGELDFGTFVTDTLHTAARIIRGQRLEFAEKITEMYFQDANTEWFGYVEPTMRGIREAGATAMIVTAAPQFIAKGIAQAHGLSLFESTHFSVSRSDSTFTGRLPENQIVGTSRKGRVPLLLRKSYDHITAFGDSEGDIEMLKQSHRPIAVVPQESLRIYAQSSGMEIIEDPSLPINHFMAA
jgi:HAD superfamily phosphoserine phosphatase-like hydrolase